MASHGWPVAAPSRELSFDRNSGGRNCLKQAKVVILSDVRLYREGLAVSLGQDPSVNVVGMGCRMCAPASLIELGPDALLLDAPVAQFSRLPSRIREIAPAMKMIAFAVSEVEHEVIACARAGVSAYVPQDASVEDIVTAVHMALRGEMACPPRMAAFLFSHLAGMPVEQGVSDPASALTRREREIVRLLELGQSNKEIARELRIEAATVRNHVHNILGKLGARRRGEVAARMRGGLPPRCSPEDDWRVG